MSPIPPGLGPLAHRVSDAVGDAAPDLAVDAGLQIASMLPATTQTLIPEYEPIAPDVDRLLAGSDAPVMDAPASAGDLGGHGEEGILAVILGVLGWPFG